MASFDKQGHCVRCRDKLKGTDPCVNKENCPHCNILTAEQKLQLSMPSYQKKKEKGEQKTGLSDKPVKADKNEEFGETLVDPSLVSVIGPTTSDKMAVKSPERASSKDKGKKKHSPKKSSTDVKLEAMDQKWPECFSRLEVFFLSKSLESPSPEPTFKTVKMPVRTPPASAVKISKPFLAPQSAN